MSLMFVGYLRRRCYYYCFKSYFGQDMTLAFWPPDKTKDVGKYFNFHKMSKLYSYRYAYNTSNAFRLFSITALFARKISTTLSYKTPQTNVCVVQEILTWLYTLTAFRRKSKARLNAAVHE